MGTTATPHLAAIISDDHVDTDDLLANFAASLKERGWWVRGLVQANVTTANGNQYPAVVDLDSGSSFPLYQSSDSYSPLGSRDGMADAVAVLKNIVCGGADLVLINRFSAEEAEGKGFAAEMLLLAMSGVPLLTVVPKAHLEAWQAFTGGRSVHIPPQLDLLHDWCTRLRIPTQTGQPFRRNLDTDSEANWTAIPTESGQPKVIT